MTNVLFYTDRSTLLSAVFEAVTDRAKQLIEKQSKLFREVPEMREALLLHMEKIREEITDADFRFFNESEGLVLEVHSPSANAFLMTFESFRNALESLKEQFGVEVKIGFTDEEWDNIRTGRPSTNVE